MLLGVHKDHFLLGEFTALDELDDIVIVEEPAILNRFNNIRSVFGTSILHKYNMMLRYNYFIKL